jgi:hypothetical protein
MTTMFRIIAKFEEDNLDAVKSIKAHINFEKPRFCSHIIIIIITSKLLVATLSCYKTVNKLFLFT